MIFCNLFLFEVLNDSICGLNIVTVDHHYRKGKYVPSHLHYDVEYMVEIDENEKLRVQEDENSGVEWLDFDTLMNSGIEEKMKPVYSKLIEKTKKLKL